MWIECSAEVANDPAAVPRELPPCDANHAPSRRDRRPVAFAVALERGLGAMERVAVELDD